MSDQSKTEMPDPLSLGIAAYQAYGDSTGWKTYNGGDMLKWEALGPSIQRAWCAAGVAAWQLKR